MLQAPLDISEETYPTAFVATKVHLWWQNLEDMYRTVCGYQKMHFKPNPWCFPRYNRVFPVPKPNHSRSTALWQERKIKIWTKTNENLQLEFIYPMDCPCPCLMLKYWSLQKFFQGAEFASVNVNPDQSSVELNWWLQLFSFISSKHCGLLRIQWGRQFVPGWTINRHTTFLALRLFCLGFILFFFYAGFSFFKTQREKGYN